MWGLKKKKGEKREKKKKVQPEQFLNMQPINEITIIVINHNKPGCGFCSLLWDRSGI